MQRDDREIEKLFTFMTRESTLSVLSLVMNIKKLVIPYFLWAYKLLSYFVI